MSDNKDRTKNFWCRRDHRTRSIIVKIVEIAYWKSIGGNSSLHWKYFRRRRNKVYNFAFFVIMLWSSVVVCRTAQDNDITFMRPAQVLGFGLSSVQPGNSNSFSSSPTNGSTSWFPTDPYLFYMIFTSWFPTDPNLFYEEKHDFHSQLLNVLLISCFCINLLLYRRIE